MVERKVVILKRHKAPAEIQKAIDMILHDLEQYGRSTTTNGKASRYLSYRLRYHKNQGKIYFRWMGDYKPPRSLIALEPETKLEILSDNKVKLVYERKLKKKV